MKIKIGLNLLIKNMIKQGKETVATLSFGLNISKKSIEHYLSDYPVSPGIQSSLFDYIVAKNYDLFDLLDYESNEYYYHMSSTGIIGQISAKYNKNKFSIYGNDFGYGFYLSESFKVASLYIKKGDTPHIYRFNKNKFNLIDKHSFAFKETNIGTEEWVLYIGLNRNKINDRYKTIINEKFIRKFNRYKCIIGKIADSLNFEVMDDFFKDDYDIFQVASQLTKANLGLQRVIKDEEFCNSLIWDDEIMFDKAMINMILKWRKYCNNKLRIDNKKSLNKNDTNNDYKFTKLMERISYDE